MAAPDVGIFRFLLEGYDNLAFLTTLEKRPPLLKLSFATESRREVIAALLDIRRSVPFEWQDLPAAHMRGEIES